MAKKKAVESAQTLESTSTDTPVVNNLEKKRGRPAGTKNSAKKSAPKKKGKPGRPKGSKNKAKSLNAIHKRPRGRPPGSGKKSIKNSAITPSGLRGIIVQIVREEVHAALLKAFTEM